MSRKHPTLTSVHYRPRTNRGPVVRFSMDIPLALAELVESRCGQLKITRVEYLRRLIERDQANVIATSDTGQPLQLDPRQNDDPADFLR